MALTFLQLAQQIADELDFTQPSTLQGSISTQVRRIKNHINRAYNYVWLQLNPFNEEAQSSTTATTTANVDYIAIPSSMNSIDEVQYSNEPPLILLPWSEFQQLRADYLLITQTGAPTRGSIYQRRIYLYPTPDAAYTFNIRGKASLTELSADADEPALRDDFHRVIFEFALFFSMAYENNPNTGLQQQIALDALRMAKANSDNHLQFPPAVRLEGEFQDSGYWRLI
jgi:hypothetical protein